MRAKRQNHHIILFSKNINSLQLSAASYLTYIKIGFVFSFHAKTNFSNPFRISIFGFSISGQRPANWLPVLRSSKSEAGCFFNLVYPQITQIFTDLFTQFVILSGAKNLAHILS